MIAERMPDPTLIARPASLKILADTLRGETIVAVDTESNSLYAYRERVCLIQFSTAKADYLVDPLALDDLSPLAPVFSEAGIEKVFHAAEYDLICLRRDYGFEFANLFDTMVAARILGREAVGLGSMLEAAFAVHLDKRYQRANWGQRPLPPHLLDYGRLDTHYLIPLRNRLRAELRQKGLWPLAQEDFGRLIALKASNGDGRPEEGEREADCWRVSGAYDLEPWQAAVLLELCRYRERAARSLDRPLFKVINDQTLLEIAAQSPNSLENLSRLRGMSRLQVKRHGMHLLQAVQRGLKAEPLYPARSPRPDNDFLERLEALRRWRKATAQELGVSSEVVLPRDLLFSLAGQNPTSLEDLSSILRETPWRLENFGSQILEALKELSR